MHFLQDLLDQTLAEAQCVLRWHSLFQVWGKATDQAERKRLVQQLAALAIGDPRADALRLTFLSQATGDARFVKAAALQTLAVQPFNPDRLAAFAAFFSLRALETQPGREAFATALNVACLPEMVNRLALEVAAMLPATLVPRVPGTIQKVAVVSSHLGNIYHTPGRLAANQCRLLARAGRRVELFSCQEQLLPKMELFHGGGGTVRLPTPEGTDWQRLLPAGVRMSVSNHRFSLRSRWRATLDGMAEFDPDVVLFIGLYSPLAAALYKVRPVVGLCTNSVPPLGPVDVWLASDEAAIGREHKVWDGQFPVPLAHIHPYRISTVGGPFALTRADLGLPDDALVCVTAGFRLEQEVGGPWATRMAGALAQHAGAVWLLVGGSGQVPKALQQLPPGKVLALATRPDVSAVLNLCDIYVNPPRMGGGFSVAEAMAANLPVLAFAGSDGGDKVGAWALAGVEAYMERLAALLTDPALRTQMGQALHERFIARFDIDASTPSLLSACALAATHAADRLSAGSS